MNARLTKLGLTLCCFSVLNIAAFVHAQDTNAEDAAPPPANANGRAGRPPGYRTPHIGDLPEFNIQIENGQLSLAYFKPWEHTNPWGTNSTVAATIENLSKYLRAIDPNLNIVLSPDVGHITIQNLKLNSRNPFSISQAVSVASGGAIVGPGGGGGLGFGGGLRGMERSLTFIANRPPPEKPSVEVFNLSGYIQTLGKVDDKVIGQKLDELEHNLIFPTLDSLHILQTGDTVPTFKYHPGTKLLIVIGNREAIEVTRKIINALSGEQKDSRLDTAPPPDQK